MARKTTKKTTIRKPKAVDILTVSFDEQLNKLIKLVESHIQVSERMLSQLLDTEVGSIRASSIDCTTKALSGAVKLIGELKEMQKAAREEAKAEREAKAAAEKTKANLIKAGVNPEAVEKVKAAPDVPMNQYLEYIDTMKTHSKTKITSDKKAQAEWEAEQEAKLQTMIYEFEDIYGIPYADVEKTKATQKPKQKDNPMTQPLNI